MEHILPDKIAWWMDLSQSLESMWSHRHLKHVKKVFDEYHKKVKMEVYSSGKIIDLFLPIYRRMIASKPDFHGNAKILEKKFQELASNEGYQLLWYTSYDGKEVYGGNVIKNEPGLVKGIYRAYDHKATNESGMQYFDYYSDYQLQRMVQEKGINKLSRGLMQHPFTQMGLTAFKLWTGAYPKKTWRQDVESRKYTMKEIQNEVEKQGMWGYFSEPDEENLYRKLTIYCQAKAFLSPYNLKHRLTQLNIGYEAIEL